MELILHPLVLLTFTPLIGVLVLLFTNPEQKNLHRWIALITSLVTLGIAIVTLVWFIEFEGVNPGELHMVVNQPWIQVAGWNISFYLGVIITLVIQ